MTQNSHHLSVHIMREPAPEQLDYLRRKLLPGIELTCGRSLPPDPAFHVLVHGLPSREELLASPQLHTLIVPWAGIPPETRKLMAEFPHISLHNLHHNAAPVAELAVALLLAAAKFIVPVDQALRHHNWLPRYEPPPTALLAGRTALILGYGAIGRRVGQVCSALGMTVLATRRHPDRDDGDGVELYGPEALPDLLPRSDALIICLPLTPETDGLIGAAELQQLPAGAILVNIGRGAVVEEAALYDALHSGRLLAAGLDVWYNYPDDVAERAHTPPGNFPFHALDNVVMSPHRAGSSDGTEQLRMAHLANLLNAAGRGEPLPNQIDLTAGY